MASWSLTQRLTVRLSAAIAALWIAATVVSTFVVRHEFNEVFDSALQETAQRLLPLAADDLRQRGAPTDWSREIREGVVVAEHEEYLIYQIRASDGRVLIRSHDAPRQGFLAPLIPGYADRNGWRVYTEVNADGDIFIQVAESSGHRNEALFNLVLTLTVPLFVLLPLSAFIVRCFVSGTLFPIASVRADIASRGGGNMAPIDDGPLPQELSPIVGDVNRLLERLQKSLEAERAFAANSAHELRTPVASALAQVSRLKADLQHAPAVERANRIEEILKELGGLVEKLLQLSRAEAGVALKREPMKLSYVARYLVDEFNRKPSYADRVELVDDTADENLDVVETDLDTLAIALRNLIENALVHGAKEGIVTISIGRDRSVRVINESAIVPPEKLHRLAERFSRGSSRAEGSGLGLAIVKTIVAQAGGELELRSPATGREDGFEAIIRFT
ncbi:ATP-binding protein [Nisaea acidiphila]|uniref:histidine kinase n=1 Tax=Nisaea acidiphila TaxID=1862145 RepID=A0A9J7ANH1_9PROT|nr:ATP-binding protein [Nisaea acidiphila]UUX48710.1 ATP-binding protein [Nisaea acidiphila]